MSEQIPRYILAPPGSLSDRLRARLAPVGPLVQVGSVEELLGAAGEEGRRPPGWILLPPALDPSTMVELLGRLAGAGEVWSPLLLVEAESGPTILPLSIAYALTLEELGDRLEAGEGGAAALSFRRALDLLSRVRHEINNALTVALAEAQLVLLDLDSESETASAIHIVEGQIQRIRDLVTELGAVRAPRR